jgi:hypothetical protein
MTLLYNRILHIHYEKKVETVIAIVKKYQQNEQSLLTGNY